MIEPSTFLRGATEIGEGCTIGPLTTIIDSRIGDDVTVRTPTSRVRGPRRRHVGPFAYLRPGTLLRERRQGRHVRRDQELRHRRGHQGPAPLLHRRRRRRRRHEHRRRQRSPPTTTAVKTSTARRSARACTRRRRHDASSRPSASATTPTPPPDSAITEDVPPGALGIARPRQTQHRGLRGAQACGALTGRAILIGAYTASGRERPRPASARHEPADRLRQAAHAVLGAGEPRAGGEDRRQARRRPRPGHAQDVLQRRGLLPLRGVDPRRRRLHHPADLRQPRDAGSAPTTR